MEPFAASVVKDAWPLLSLPRLRRPAARRRSAPTAGHSRGPYLPDLTTFYREPPLTICYYHQDLH